MTTKVFWRIAAPFVLLTLGLTLGLYVYLTRDHCRASVDCPPRAILVAAVLAMAATLLIAGLMARRMTRALRDTVDAVNRIAAGDTTLRVLPSRQDETTELLRAIRRLVERQQDQLDRLTEDRRQFSTVLDHMADGVLITDSAGRIELINPAGCRLLKTAEGEATGRSFAAVVRHHLLIELWQRCHDQGTEQIEAIELSPQLFLQTVVTPFEQLGEAGYVIILQDLTQVRRLQVMRRDFISNLSHELRSPLASLRAVVETLQDGALADPPAAERFLRQAENEVNTMTQMVDELTELSQIESGQVRLRLATVPVRQLVEAPVERLRPQAERAGIRLNVEIAGDVPPALVDEERIQQVITNLLHNAIKFTPPGGQVWLVASAADDENAGRVISIEVRDTGIGIAKQELPRIFERFYKSDRARTRGQGGTGLGLAIARHIVETHGGRMGVKSKVGKGSSFTFTMPIAGD